MKLTINHREQQKSLFKSGGYFLDFTLELTAEELAEVKRHQWEGTPLCKYPHQSVVTLERAVRQSPHTWFFDNLPALQAVEEELIESIKTFKHNLDAVPGFLSDGPREVDL